MVMSKTSLLSRCKVPSLLALGFCVGVVINQLGLVMESIRLHVELVKSDKSSSSHSTFKELMQRLPHINQSYAASPYVVPNTVHYFCVVSVYRIQHPDAVWFHCNHLPDISDFYWNQLWKFVPLTVIYHKQQTSNHERERDLKPARDAAVVAVLLDHGGIFVDWNILVVHNLNPLRNYSTCFSKESGSLQTDIILAGRNAEFLQLVSASLQSPMGSLSSVIPSLYKQQLNMPLFESFSAQHSKSDWQSQYIVRIPAESRLKTEESIKTGSDVLSTAMRYIYYGSTDLLS